MTTDMLRWAGEGEATRAEAFAEGEAEQPRRVPSRPASGVGRVAPPAIDLRALVMRAVVPRLAENLRLTENLRAAPMPPAAPGEADDRLVGELVDSLLRDDLAGVYRSIEAARAGGRPLDRVYLDLLAPAAAAVARLACADDCSPAAGTLAFCNLQIVLRRYAADFYGEQGGAEQGSRALLVPTRAAAGAEAGLSTFGLLLAADFLRRAGWEAWIEPSFRSASLADTVRGHWFDLVQVLADDAALGEDDVREVTAGIRAIRQKSANPRLVVVACGPAFARDPALAERLGADRGARDPLSALPPSHSFDHASHRQARRRRRLS